uniref:uncharacterized protein LOC120339640 n=1 Tax=Styela clava TaxID=7725 RepID=UPI00193A03B7|nr:uncharacterized protein LOC120339640 [Styela clava]
MFRIPCSFFTIIGWILYFGFITEVFGGRSKTGPNWYRGCHFLPDPETSGRLSRQPLYEISQNWTPAKCAKKCMDAKEYSFAFLFNGNACFCRKYLTRKVYESSCNQRCRNDRAFKCGGTTSVSAYSVNGPYIASIHVVVRPKKVVRNQQVKVTVMVELASDISTKIGLMRFEQTSFRTVTVTANLEYRTKKKVNNIIIRGRKGQIEFTHRYDSEGLKPIDVVVKNTISTLSTRRYIQVESRIPRELSIRIDRQNVQMCTPTSSDGDSVFVGEYVTLQASVASGFNLTFDWNFCGIEVRKFSTHMMNPTCVHSVCHSDAQPFTFRESGKCNIEVRVHNNFGSVTSHLPVSVITPELRDLSLTAQPLTWGGDPVVENSEGPSTPVEPWSLPGHSISEGATGGRGGSYAPEDYPSNNFPSKINFYPFGDRDVTPTPPIEQLFQNHIPLKTGQYLKDASIKFEASAFVTNFEEGSFVEINFGDGERIFQPIEVVIHGFPDMRRKRRSVQNSIRTTWTEVEEKNYFSNEKTDSKSTDYTNMSFYSWIKDKQRPKRSITTNDNGYEDYLNNLGQLGPYTSMGEGGQNPEVEFTSRDGGFRMSEGFDFDSTSYQLVDVIYGDNCHHSLKFEHSYKVSGKFNVTLKLHNGTYSLSTFVKSGLQVLDGTPELNIRCPDTTELGKSIILSVSSTIELPDILTWKIFRRSAEEDAWVEDENLEQRGYSFKKSFLLRGFYKIEVYSSDKQPPSTCVLQVEEPLSGLSVKTDSKYVQTGTQAIVRISLEAGTSASLDVAPDDIHGMVNIEKSSKGKWNVYFNVIDTKCYELTVNAKNPVSNISSDVVEICGEEPISGFQVQLPDIADLNSEVPIKISFERGSNIHITVNVFTLFGMSNESFDRTITDFNKRGVEILSPQLTKLGIYRVVAKASNRVPAKTQTCDKMSVSSEAEVLVTKFISPDARISIEKHIISRAKENQMDDMPWSYVYDAKLDGKLQNGDGYLYRWTLQTVTKMGDKTIGVLSKRYTPSPLFGVELPKCIALVNSPDDVTLKYDVSEMGEMYAAQSPICKVSVEVISVTNNATDFHVSVGDTGKLSTGLILPQSSVIETKSSCEFDIKCPDEAAPSCEVSFGDGSEPMKIHSNSNWNSLSHAYTIPGLYEITIKSYSRQTRKSTILNSTNVVVQDKILTLKLEGIDVLSFEENPSGVWKATVQSGSDVVYHWSVKYQNETTLHQEYSRAEEWEYTFPHPGEYILDVVASNDVSRQSGRQRVTVLQTHWYFNVQANSSILGKPSSFIVSTNASSNIVAVRFEDSGKTIEYDLSCLEPNFTSTNEENKIIKSYVISYTYNQTGSYEATFSLLSRTDDDRMKRLYTLKTDVMHKPAPKNLLLDVIGGDVTVKDGKYYIATFNEVVIRATTNFHTEFFSWDVWNIQGMRRDMIHPPSPVEATNSSTANFSYMIEQQGIYEIRATSHTDVVKSSLIIEAQEIIRKVWVDKPYNPRDTRFVNFCRLKRNSVNKTVEYRCDSLTLTAFSYGSQVTFYFYIKFRPEVPGDYTVPTEVIDVIQAKSKRKLHGPANEASIEYSFTKQGVHSITIVASNNLGNQSAEIPAEKPSFGPTRPFLFYAQRPVARISLSQSTFYVALGALSSFEVKLINTRQVVKVRWDMGDGTRLLGQTVQHAYRTPGIKTMNIVAENFVNSKSTSAFVKVEIPIEDVKIQEMPLTYSTLRPVRLRAFVKPSQSASNYTWYLRNDNNTETSYRNFIDNRFTKSGMYLVKVIAANHVSSMESEAIEIEIQEPIHAKFIGDEVVRRHKEVTMSVQLHTGSDVSVYWRIDGKPLANKTLEIKHVFEKKGQYKVHINLINKLGSFNIKKLIFVEDRTCDIPKVKISKGDVWIKRSKPLRLEADVNLNCSFLATVNYQWRVYIDELNTIEVELNDVVTTNRILELEPRTLSYGIYYFIINVSVSETILFGSSKEKIGVVPSNLVAMIDGGNVRTIARATNVTIDASSSYDPDYPDNNEDLIFGWKCFVLNSPNTPCFKSLEEDDDEPPHHITERSALSTEQPETGTSSMRAADEYITEEAHDESVYRDFPDGISTNGSVLKFPASMLVQTADAFVFQVDVSKPDPSQRHSDKVLVLKIEKGQIEWVTIHSQNCKTGAVARHVPLQFEASCVTCSHNHDQTSIAYEWSIHEVEDSSASFYENDTSDCAPPDGTGWMSLIGIFGNESEFTNGSDTDPLLKYLTNITSGGEFTDDSNFYGSLVPDHLLTDHWPEHSQRPPPPPIGGDISEGKSPSRNGDFDGSRFEDDNDGIPPVPLKRVLRTAVPIFEIHQSENVPNMPTFPLDNIDGESNMRDGYGIGGQRPLGAPPSQDLDEELTGSRFGGGNNYNYGPYGFSHENEWAGRSGIIPYSPGMDGLPPIFGDSQRRGDAFRMSDHSSNIRLPNHYQDLDHTKLELANIALSGINDKMLILRPNTLTEGRTYAITNEIFLQDGKMKKSIGKTSYYFTVLRGPSYGDCSVVYRDFTKNYLVHCAGWKNQQNGNARDRVSRREMLSYDISYSLTEKGPTRQIYTGVSHEKYFRLPKDNKPAYIHIVLRNSDGASTNVCSFLPNGPIKTNLSLTTDELLQEAYSEAVPSNGSLGEMLAMGDQEEVIALVNVILDTIPEVKELQRLEKETEEPIMKMSRQIIYNTTMALKSLIPRKINEVQYIVETLIRAISRGKLFSANTLFEAANLLIECVDALRNVTQKAKDSGNNQYILSDEEMMNMLVNARLALSEACIQCSIRIESKPDKDEIEQAKKILFGNFTELNDLRKVSIKSKLMEMEKKVYSHLNKFFLDLIHYRPKVLGPIRSRVDNLGIVVQSFSKVVNVFESDDDIFGKSGSWKAGFVFSDEAASMTKWNTKLAESYVISSTLPDMTLSGFKEKSIEHRPISLSLYNVASTELLVHNFDPPVVVSLPPRSMDKVSEFHGIIFRDRVSTNSFPVHKMPNRTMHLEIILGTHHQRSFPVTIAVIKPTTEHHSGTPHSDQIVSKQVVSRGQFQDFNALNQTIAVKFTLKDEDFSHKHGMYYIAFWNEQVMTSRSRHYDIEFIHYTLRIWWSDCFFWDDIFMEWRQDGVKVMEQSTSTQTICKTSHLTTFSSSFIPVKTDAQASDIGISIGHTALRGSITIVSIILVATLVFLYIHYRILRPRELETPTSVFRVDYYGSRPRFSEIGRRLRWFFGPDQKSNSVPIILHDNRKTHKQVFEVTLQTSCWPGSGTTSNVTIILYGEEGKYEARELITPKTHNAREARYENGYSENDDYTGVDDELFITGSTQKFIITYPVNLGPLWKLVIWHDNSGECPSWRLDHVTVRDVNEKKKWHFPLYDWLSLDRGKKSLCAELRPLYSPPSFYKQVALRLNTFLCNMSSVCSLIVAPGYGQQPRSQRAIHLFTLLVTIFGLTTARYMLEWDIYSHDTDLPYIHTVSKSWGLIIGIGALLIVLPAQLLLNFSKHDEKISVTIEDATISLNGTDFPDDRTSYRYTSSINISKPPDEHLDRDNNVHYHTSLCALPSVEDTVCDWLELKAQSEQGQGESPSRNTINKELHLPGACSSVASPQWRQSTNSLDEEIVRCMMTSTEIRKSQTLRDVLSTGKSATQLLDDDDKSHDYNGSKVHVNSFLAEQYASMGGIYSSIGSTLAMDGPELVPCEKLEPIPQDFSALLPRGCRKLAWLYYALACLCSCGVTIYGSLILIRSYDLGPWLECIMFAAICVLVLVEGLLIFIFAMLASIYSSLKWMLSDEPLWNMLDRMFSTSDVSSVTENSLDVYTDSTSFHIISSQECLSANAEAMIEDARIAREIGDRERTRYLRHVEPPTEVPNTQEKKRKIRKIKKATTKWIEVIFLLFIGIIAAVIVSEGFKESSDQSRDVKDWFIKTSTFPSSGGYITTDMYNMRNNSISYNYQSVKSRESWLKWFDKVLMDCPKSQERAKLERSSNNSPESYLARKYQKYLYQSKGAQKIARYLLIGTPTLIVKQYETLTNRNDIPAKVLLLLNRTVAKSITKSHDESIPKVNTMLKRSSDSMQRDISLKKTTITYQVPSWVVKTQDAIGRLSALRRFIRDHVTVNSVTVDVILYNPYANLYSHISAISNFHNPTGSRNFAETSCQSTVMVSSLSLSLTGVDRTNTSTAWKSFFLCQMLLLCWIGYKFLHSLVSLTTKILKRFAISTMTESPKTKLCCSRLLMKFSLGLLDLCIWCLSLLCIGISASRRAHIETIMPYIYGYDSPNGDTYKSLSFVDIIQSFTRLSTTYGMLNFFLIIKLLTIGKLYHNFPKFPTYSKNRKIATGQVVSILLLFWAVSIILAFIGYLIFADDSSFSSFIHALATILLSSLSLGSLPINTSFDMKAIRAKYGTLVTVWFFVTIFVTLRLVLRGLLVAACQKRVKGEGKTTSSQTNYNITVTFKEMLEYNWDRLKYIGLCTVCIILQRDPGMWGAHNDVEFTSLGFSKSKQLTGREKKKLGSSASYSHRSTPVKTKVEQQKENEEGNCKSKYNLPSGVLLSEIETQLDELYLRASALADMACNEIPPEELISVFYQKQGEKRNDTLDKTECILSPPTLVKSKEVESTKNDDREFTDRQNQTEVTSGKPPIRRPIANSKRNPKRRLTNNNLATISNERATLTKQKEDIVTPRIDKCGLNKICRSEPTEPQEDNAPSPRLQKVHPRKHFGQQKQIIPCHALNDVNNIMTSLDPRKYGWISDDDTLDRSSDVSAVSSSSFLSTNTPVPPLTKHNLARHNYHIISRQTSTITGSSGGTANTVRLSDVPSTSSAPYESPPELPSTLSDRFWRTLSLMKRYFGREEMSQNEPNKVRPLRRSRTAAINVKDLPSLESLRDSDGGSDRTGKKSSASTTKIRSVLTGAKRSLEPRSRATRVRNITSTRQINSPSSSRSPMSEISSLQSRSRDFLKHDDLETFSIPGTVIEESQYLPSVNTITKNLKSHNGGEKKTIKQVRKKSVSRRNNRTSPLSSSNSK